MKLSSEIAHFRPVETPGQSCHNCLFRLGGQCAKVAITTSPDMVCDTWVLNPNG